MIVDGKRVRSNSLEAKAIARQMRWHRKMLFRSNYERRRGKRYQPPKMKRNRYIRPHQGQREKDRRWTNIDKAIATAII